MFQRWQRLNFRQPVRPSGATDRRLRRIDRDSSNESHTCSLLAGHIRRSPPLPQLASISGIRKHRLPSSHQWLVFFVLSDGSPAMLSFCLDTPVSPCPPVAIAPHVLCHRPVGWLACIPTCCPPLQFQQRESEHNLAHPALPRGRNPAGSSLQPLRLASMHRTGMRQVPNRHTQRRAG